MRDKQVHSPRKSDAFTADSPVEFLCTFQTLFGVMHIFTLSWLNSSQILGQQKYWLINTVALVQLGSF